jgi:hypothetical protein
MLNGSRRARLDLTAETVTVERRATEFSEPSWAHCLTG